jgi:hypothetical protein
VIEEGETMKTRIVFTVGLILGLGVLSTACGSKLNPKFDKAVSSALDATKGEFKTCYEDALTRDREAQGDMDLAISFKADATKPEDVDIRKSDIRDDDMKKCVKQAAKGISVSEKPGTPVEKRQQLLFKFEG